VAFFALAATLVILLADTERLASPEEILRDRSGFFDPPFAKYYWSSEFQAGSNATGKMIVFAIMGFLIANLCSVPGQRGERPPWIATTLAACCILLTAIVIEVAQIYLHPSIGDNTDVMLYCLGGLGGWWAYRMLVTWNHDQPATAAYPNLRARTVAGGI
jgi:glycopeptide antibiotics resistance protein